MNKSTNVKKVRVTAVPTQKRTDLPTAPASPAKQGSVKREVGHVHMPQDELLDRVLIEYRQFCRTTGMRSTPISLTTWAFLHQRDLFNKLKTAARRLQICQLKKCRSNWQAKLIILPAYRQGHDTFGLETDRAWFENFLERAKTNYQAKHQTARQIVEGTFKSRRLNPDDVPDEFMAPITPTKGRVWITIDKNRFNKTVAALFRGSRDGMLERIARNVRPEYRKLSFFLIIERILSKYMFGRSLRFFLQNHERILGAHKDTRIQDYLDEKNKAKPPPPQRRVVITRKQREAKEQADKEAHQKLVIIRPQPAQPHKKETPPHSVALPPVDQEIKAFHEAAQFRVNRELRSPCPDYELLSADLIKLAHRLCPHCTEAAMDAVSNIVEAVKTGGLKGGQPPSKPLPKPPSKPLPQLPSNVTTSKPLPKTPSPQQTPPLRPSEWLDWYDAVHCIDDWPFDSPSEYETDVTTDEEIDRMCRDDEVVTIAGIEYSQSENPDESGSGSQEQPQQISSAQLVPLDINDLEQKLRECNLILESLIDENDEDDEVSQHSEFLDSANNSSETNEVVSTGSDEQSATAQEENCEPQFTLDNVPAPPEEVETPQEPAIDVSGEHVHLVNGQEFVNKFEELPESAQEVILQDAVDNMDQKLVESGQPAPSQEELVAEREAILAARQRRRKFRTQIKKLATPNELGFKIDPKSPFSPQAQTEIRKRDDQERVSGLFEGLPDGITSSGQRIHGKIIPKAKTAVTYTVLEKHEGTAHGKFVNGPPRITTRKVHPFPLAYAVGLLNRHGRPIVLDSRALRPMDGAKYEYCGTTFNYPWPFHPVAFQGQHTIHWIDSEHPRLIRGAHGSDDEADDQGALDDDGGQDGYDDMGGEDEFEDKNEKHIDDAKKAEECVNDWEEDAEKDIKIDLDYTKKFTAVQYMIAASFAFTLVQINLAFIFLYALLLLGLPATHWTSRVKKVFSNDVDRRPAKKSTICRQLIVSTLRKTRGLYNPFFGWIYKWSRTESDFNDTLVQMYAWETANKLEKPDKTLFYSKYKDQVNNSVNQVERWRKTTLKAMKIVDRQRRYVPATFWLMTYLVGYSAAKTDDLPLKPVKDNFSMLVTPIDEAPPTVWYGLLDPPDMARLNYAPCTPNRNEQEHTILGAINRIGVDNGQKLNLAPYLNMIDEVIDTMFAGYTGYAPPLDSDTMYHWVLSRPYTTAQKQELLKTLSLLNTMDLTYEDIIDEKDFRTMGFGKNENYEKYKFMRMICAGGPMRKLIYGPLFQSLSDWFFRQEWSMKKIPIQDRGTWLQERFPKYGHYYVTDHSNFECSATSQVQDAIEAKVYRRFIDPSNHQFLEYITNGIDGQQKIYTRKGVIIETPVVRNSGEMNTSLGNSILNAISAQVAFKSNGANIDFVVEGDDGLILSDKYVDPKDIERVMEELGCRIKIEYHHSMETTSFCSTCFVDGTPTVDWKRNFVKVPWKSTFTSSKDRLEELRQKIGSLVMHSKNSALSKALTQAYHVTKAAFPNDMYIKEALLAPLEAAYKAADAAYETVAGIEVSSIAENVKQYAATAGRATVGVMDEIKETAKSAYTVLKSNDEFRGKEKLVALENKIKELNKMLEDQNKQIMALTDTVVGYTSNFSHIITNIPAQILEELRKPINFTDIYNDAAAMKVPPAVVESAVKDILNGDLPKAINDTYDFVEGSEDMRDMAQNYIKNATASETPGGFREKRTIKLVDAWKNYSFRQFTSGFSVALSIGEYLMQFASPEFWLVTIMALFLLFDQLLPMSPMVLLVLFNGNIFAYFAGTLLLVRTNRYFRLFISAFGAVLMNLFLFGPMAFGFVAGLGGQNHYNKF